MTIAFVLFCGALGAVLASFAGVVSERLNTGESWFSGRSRCNACARPLNGFDLIPVFSWLASGGSCRTCGTAVPYRYPVAEAVLGIVFAAAAFTLGPGVMLIALLLTLFVLAVIVLYDLRHTIVPLSLSLVLIVLSIWYAYLAIPNLSAFSHALITAGAIGLGFFLMHVLSKGRWMGLGDAPVALALSLLAAPYALAGLLFSFWIGAAVGILLLVSQRRGHRMNSEIPFVPFLAAGYLLAFFTQWNPLPF